MLIILVISTEEVKNKLSYFVVQALAQNFLNENEVFFLLY